MVEIKIVKTKKDRKNFINFENKLYSECEFFVPTVYKKEKHLFNVKKNPDLMSNETTGYLAYQDGKVVGRVLCIFNRIEKEKRNIIRFSHLDFINDSEVSFALLDVVEKWARFLKSEKIIGDISFNDTCNIGILNSGFDKFASFQLRYNYPYYSEHLKDYGYSIAKKLKEYQIELIDYEQVTKEQILDNTNYKLVSGDIEFKIKNYGRKIFDLVYQNSVSGYPIVIEEGVYERFFKNLNKLYTSDDFIILINENDDVMGAMLVTNNTSLALQITEGKEFSSKNNYNVDMENSKYVDLSLFVSNQDNEIESIMNKLLRQSMISKNNKFLNTNLWFQDKKDSPLLEGFKAIWDRERVIFNKNIKTPIIKRNKDDLADPHRIAETSTLQ